MLTRENKKGLYYGQLFCCRKNILAFFLKINTKLDVASFCKT